MATLATLGRSAQRSSREGAAANAPAQALCEANLLDTERTDVWALLCLVPASAQPRVTALHCRDLKREPLCGLSAVSAPVCEELGSWRFLQRCQPKKQLQLQYLYLQVKYK